MPLTRPTIYTFACGICNAEYSYMDEDTAHVVAGNCEKLGIRERHRFQERTKVIANTKDPSGALTFSCRGIGIEIARCFFEKITHKPMYHLKFLSSIDGAVFQEHRSFPAENIWFLTVIHRQTTGITTKSGQVKVETRVIESMEPK